MEMLLQLFTNNPSFGNFVHVHSVFYLIHSSLLYFVPVSLVEPFLFTTTLSPTFMEFRKVTSGNTTEEIC